MASDVITQDDIDAKLKSFRLQNYDEVTKLPQRGDAWLQARCSRITGSRFGSAAGHCRYQSPSGCVKQMLWHKFVGNDGMKRLDGAVRRRRRLMLLSATRWGTKMEPVALEAYTKYLSQKRKTEGYQQNICVKESGLNIRKAKPWFAASPDGIVHDVTRDSQGREITSIGLLEIKCPYSRRDKTGSQRFYPRIIPQYYWDQIQGQNSPNPCPDRGFFFSSYNFTLVNQVLWASLTKTV